VQPYEEVELKKFRIAASGLMKEREAVEAEVESMRMSIEEKDKESRAAAIRIRQLKDKMKPKPRAIPKPLEGTVDSTFLTSMDSLSMMGTQPLTLPPPPPAVQLVINIPEVVLQINVRPPEQTHVMLCLLEGESAAAGSDWPAGASPHAGGLDLQELAELEEAAAKIQGVARRRRDSAEGHEAAAGEGEGAAAAEGAEGAEAAGVGDAAPAPEPVPEAGRASEPAAGKPKKETTKKGGKQPVKHK
jgi:hypothetical protein